MEKSGERGLPLVAVRGKKRGTGKLKRPPRGEQVLGGAMDQTFQEERKTLVGEGHIK